MVNGGGERGVPRGALLAVLAGVGVVVALIIAYQALSVLTIIVFAALLALVLRTVARGLERLGIPPFFVAIILLGGVAAAGAALYFLVLPDAQQEIRDLISRQGPGSLGAVSQSLEGLPFSPDPNEIAERLQSRLGGFIGAAPRFLSTAAGVITGLLALVFLALYFASSPDTYIGGMLRLVPPERRDGVRHFLGVLSERLRGWIVGTALVSVFVGVTAAVGLSVGLWIIGVPLPLTFGILAGILNIIPLFGSIIGGALPALVALTISPIKALMVVGLFVIINQIDGNVLQPQIIGRQVDVPPALILISILLLGTLLGPVVGTLLAIPAAVLVVTLVDFLAPEGPSSKSKQAVKGEGAEEEHDRDG